MLELAAKAVGYAPLKVIHRFNVNKGSYVEYITAQGFTWNPYEDVDDSARLAEMLRIEVDANEDGVELFQESVGYFAWASSGDIHTTVRRAIVQIAAEVAKI